jgi:hypothetical protein
MKYETAENCVKYNNYVIYYDADDDEFSSE